MLEKVGKSLEGLVGTKVEEREEKMKGGEGRGMKG